MHSGRSGRMCEKCHCTSPDIRRTGGGAEYPFQKGCKNFLEDLRSGKSSPLKNITSNYHDHLIMADSEETLDLIEDALEEKKMLVRDDS